MDYVSKEIWSCRFNGHNKNKDKFSLKEFKFSRKAFMDFKNNMSFHNQRTFVRENACFSVYLIL